MRPAGAGIAGLLSRREQAANTALLCDQGAFSYAQLEQRVEYLCAGLSALGVKPGMTIGCAAPDCVLNLLLLHALPRLGCAFLPLNSSLPAASVRRFISLGKVDVLIAEAPLVEGVACIRLEQLLAMDARLQPGCARLMPLAASSPHWLVCSSGTEGEGKLVLLTGDQLLSSVQASRERLCFTASDTWLLCLPMFHIGGLMIPLRCAEAGAKLVLHQGYDPVRLWHDLHQHGVTHLSLVPAMLARLLQHSAGQPPPAHLRVVLTGGAALPPGMAQAALNAGWPLCPSYGMTEAASQVATLYPPPSRYVEGLVGRPLAHLQVKIAPESGRIMIKGGSMMLAYAGQPAQHDGWLLTSDLGRLDEHGNLTVLGRSDEVFISGGENVHPRQLEHILLDCPGVEDVAVTAVSHTVWGDKLVALYVGELSCRALRAWSKTSLPGFMRPKDFVRVDALPRTALGKLRRKLLPGVYGFLQEQQDKDQQTPGQRDS